MLTIASWDDVARIALALPETEEGTTFGNRAWKVAHKPKPKAFAWYRPLNKSDVRALTELGREIPEGELLGVRTDGFHHREALLNELGQWVFSIPHFDNFPAVLVKLDDVPLDVLTELLTDAWAAMAPPKLAAQYVAEHDDT
ncbi:MAG: MmcQ/YjbR family DNA-binding protein [Solirubrobacterales bacterium]|nr:MmcQ/YjbR family DNA-binding protein [Solirubrobacterales bacterium]